ncbi:MAG: hypothetical protein GWN67_15655 [Phycisphaerae bacterium]|nr:OmpH family outer membrane protein [Phycisphaerae bacterium]NIP53546.1 OmpH family outer membrane protein [Phycisphaerae bacterium]NIS54455.1 OmpH family outer membrane protein [Phycisphaerae bacterium]NIU12095.1 OmpH family outer membrane protein [Phycisphaerae bacterium]NIU57768.1 hypothetical protein [Phycisphaerae bacterium]
MEKNKITWPFILVVILTAAVCSGFIFDWGKKKDKDPNAAEAATTAAQEKRAALTDEKIAELNRKIDEQARQLTAQEEKLASLTEITKRVDGIEAGLKKREVDINDSDMSAIQEMIKEQVKSNVKMSGKPAAGVVSVRNIFRDCKKSAKYRQQSNIERQRADAELTKLDNDIKAQQEGLKTLKPDSENYMTEIREILEKQASLQALQKFYKQQISLNEQRITEEIYGDILRITAAVAKQRGLNYVFEISAPQLPAMSPTELELSMGMHKLLYSEGCIDLTDEVMTILDSNI